MPALVQIAGGVEGQGGGEGPVDVDAAVGRGRLCEGLNLIERECEIRVGAEVGGDLLCARFVDSDTRGLKCRIRRQEFIPDLGPGEGLLSVANRAEPEGARCGSQGVPNFHRTTLTGWKERRQAIRESRCVRRRRSRRLGAGREDSSIW